MSAPANAPASPFVRMRARLQERGFLDDNLQLTDAGLAHTAQLIEDLREAEAPCEPEAPRVRWRHNFAQRRR